ncbi:MAG: transcriptional regulator [Rhizobiales bacterium 24-66-13]|jgi:CRP/FNR family nitrogen fixation transcriptional regulator|nr:MAG: transcriptional regulator [Rhizobiales bacterium 12-66-7]OYZ78086.1 MAG: transcriptional regulator [Rhizobiales bacterium 24-66-13]OZA94791.1 MAG: transcriptional regulator [Rhizobiales bacterium 39-66-18]HQS10625.1 helix-turn-helix domain-containing protein [Xanthobacteraceae bacterium]HQS45894.1 helix-turn-helix domain-containing protein [Xanthobacteraceae bacterium]
MPATAAAIVANRAFPAPLPAAIREEEDVLNPAAAVARMGTVVSFTRNAEIFGEDEPADHVFVVLSGVVRICKLLGDGRRQIETFCLKGDAFGWETAERTRFSAEAVSECRLARVKRSLLFSRATDDSALARAIWNLTFTELHRAQDHLLLLGRKTAQERVATFLLDLARRSSPVDLSEVHLPMSRQDIADYLGLTIETVSRTLTQLEGSAAIALPSSRCIVLRDRNALRRLDS